jgi:hypothetical protein
MSFVRSTQIVKNSLLWYRVWLVLLEDSMLKMTRSPRHSYTLYIYSPRVPINVAYGVSRFYRSVSNRSSSYLIPGTNEGYRTKRNSQELCFVFSSLTNSGLCGSYEIIVVIFGQNARAKLRTILVL